MALKPDLRQGSHLPNLRPGGQPPNPNWLPRQRRGTTPQMVGRYPDYDVLANKDGWDEATRRVVLKRLEPPVRMRFFDPAEERTLRRLCDLLMAQDGDPRVPVAEALDGKLAAGELDGYQYEDMPDDRDTWRLVLLGLEEASRERGGAEFAELEVADAEQLVAAFMRGELQGGVFEHLNCKRAAAVCMRMVASAFYAHPWAWNEIGFGGPAYPQGFMRIGPVGTREPYERGGASDEDPVGLAEELEP